VTVTTPWVDASKRLQLINTLAAGIVVSHWSTVLTVAIAGVIVAILKGPRASGPLPEGSASRRGEDDVGRSPAETSARAVPPRWL
jgi:hypothetical protein